MTFDDAMERVVHGFEIGGVLVLVIGSLTALVSAAVATRRSGIRAGYQQARQGIGRAILLGLEFLIIADIVLTITVDTTLTSTLSLGIVVLVRTFLSFSLEVELEGSLPWRRSTVGPNRGPLARAGSVRAEDSSPPDDDITSGEGV